MLDYGKPHILEVFVAFSILLSICNLGVGLNSKQRPETGHRWI